MEGGGKYCASCVPDDIWWTEKIETSLIIHIEISLCYMTLSDVITVDADGRQIINRALLRTHHIFHSGIILRPDISHFVIGCTVLLFTDLKDCYFCKACADGQYLGLYVAMHDFIYSFASLIQFWIYVGN